MVNNEHFKIQVHTKGETNDITYQKWKELAVSEKNKNYIVKDIIKHEQQKGLNILWFSFDDQANLSIAQ